MSKSILFNLLIACYWEKKKEAAQHFFISRGAPSSRTRFVCDFTARKDCAILIVFHFQTMIGKTVCGGAVSGTWNTFSLREVVILMKANCETVIAGKSDIALEEGPPDNTERGSCYEKGLSCSGILFKVLLRCYMSMRCAC